MKRIISLSAGLLLSLSALAFQSNSLDTNSDAVALGIVTNIAKSSGLGMTNLIPWSLTNATTVPVVFNGSLQEMTLTNTAGVNFTNFTGTSGSYAFNIYSNVPVSWNTYTLQWLTQVPTVVINGTITFTVFGTVVRASYAETTTIQ